MTPAQEQRLNDLIHTVDGISKAVCGDPLSGRQGLHKRMDEIQATVIKDKNELEGRIHELEKTSDKEKTKVAAIAAGICMVGSGIIKWIFSYK
jgi:uncharacterized protein (DUF488 family)